MEDSIAHSKRDQSSFLKLGLLGFLVSLAVFGIIYWLESAVSDESRDLRQAILLLGSLQLFATGIAVLKGRPNFIMFFGLSSFCFLTAPKILVDFLEIQYLIPPNQVEALHCISWCFFIILVFYFVPYMAFEKRMKTKNEIPTINMRKDVFVMMVFAQFLFILPAFSIFPQVWRLALLAITLLVPPKASRMSLPLVCGTTFVVEGVIYIQSSALMTLFFSSILFFVVALHRKHILITATAAGLAIMLCIFQVTKGDYRNFVWVENMDSSFEDRLKVLLELNQESGLDIAQRRDALETMLTQEEVDFDMLDSSTFVLMFPTLVRVNDDSFERVLEQTPSKVPYWEGETYSFVLYSFIPRFLWPYKPLKLIWQKFGALYGYLHEEDTSTSIMFNIFAEAFMNYGMTGLVCFGMIMGTLLFAIEMASKQVFTEVGVFAELLSIFPFLNPHADFSSMVSNYLYVLIILVVAKWFIGRRADVYSEA